MGVGDKDMGSRGLREAWFWESEGTFLLRTWRERSFVSLMGLSYGLWSDTSEFCCP
jgi:hypothetical protein